MTSDVVMYSREPCPLCDKAREALEREDIAFEEVDISGDPELEAEYGEYVPVVEVSGRIIFHAGMDANALPDLVVESRP